MVEKLKASALRGEVNVRKLYEMSSADRRAFFAKYTDDALGEFINTRFEQAMISRQQDALLNWAQSVFKPEAKEKPVYKTVVDKINNLDELGVLSPKTERAFLEDLVADKLGVRVTPDEVRNISERAVKIQKAQEALGDDLGNPAKADENLEFFKAKKEMDDYLASLSPAPALRVATGTIGRGMMLASIKSLILNIGSNIEVGLLEAFTRRISSGKITGASNRLALDYVRMVNRIYTKTGYDISRMRSINDTGASGARTLGEDKVHTQGGGAVHAIGRVVENIVFKNLMGAPDTAFASIHFADSVNLNARRMAGSNAEAKILMTDAMRVKPQTVKGELLREQAILDAEYATWTNVSWATKFSEGVRKIINDLTGDLRVGDYVFPFVRTPSNVVATGLDFAGLGAPKALMKTYRAFKTGDLRNKEYIQAVTRDLSRAGLGLVGALAIASTLSNDDFVGAYDPRRKQIEQLRNSSDNSIRVGGKWISVDWLGPLAVPLTAMMYARTYGDNPKEKTFQYLLGMGAAIAQLPVIEELMGWYKEYEYNKNQTFDEMTDSAKEYAIQEARSRLIPSIFSDIAKAIDPQVRDTTGLSGFKKIAASLPFLSMGLPEKKNIWGESIMGEPIWSDILFGSRVRTDRETPLVKELNRISEETGKTITFTDWTTTTGKKLAQFREKVGSEKYEEARVKYGQKLKAALEAEMQKPGYAQLSDEEKYTLLNGLDTKAIDAIFQEYGFKYQQETKKKTGTIAPQSRVYEDSSFTGPQDVRNIKEYVLKNIPFLDSTRVELAKAKFGMLLGSQKENDLLKGGSTAAGEYSPAGTDFHNFVMTRRFLTKGAKKFIVENTPLVESFDKANIRIASSDDSDQVMLHEMMHHLFELSPMGPTYNRKNPTNQNAEFFGNKFDEDWNASVEQYPVLAEIDAHIEDHYALDDMSLSSFLTERYAYLGERVKDEGLEVIPPPLQKYYKSVFDPTTDE